MTIPKINSSHGSETRNIINAAIDSINMQGKTIQDLVAEGQLTLEQYAELITIINSNLKSGEVGKFELTPELRLEVNRISDKINKGEVTESDITGTLQSLVNSIPNKINRGEVTVNDIDINKGKLLPKHASEELLSMIAGDAPIHAVPADGSITTAKIAPLAITTSKIAHGAIENARLADISVTAEKIRSNAVENAKIAPKAVTGSKIDDATIQERSLIDKIIGKEKIKDGAIGIDQLEDVISDFNNFSINPNFQDGKLMSVEEYKGATLIRRTTLNYGADNTVNSVVTEIPNKKMTTALTFDNNTLSNVKNTVNTGGL